MAYLIDLPTYSDERGSLTVLEKNIPFDIKRVYYIYGVNPGILRGGHRHKITIQAAVSIKGSSYFFVNNGVSTQDYLLDSPQKCLVINPEDWHTMKFSDDAILIVLASEYFNPDDYIAQSY